eukprot:3393388-Amphidinium_carterae.1
MFCGECEPLIPFRGGVMRCFLEKSRAVCLDAAEVSKVQRQVVYVSITAVTLDLTTNGQQHMVTSGSSCKLLTRKIASLILASPKVLKSVNYLTGVTDTATTKFPMAPKGSQLVLKTIAGL